MGHNLIIKLWQAFVILAAFGAGYWQWLQQVPLVAMLATGLSVLLAGLPLPLIASRPLVMYRIGCRADDNGRIWSVGENCGLWTLCVLSLIFHLRPRAERMRM